MKRNNYLASFFPWSLGRTVCALLLLLALIHIVAVTYGACLIAFPNRAKVNQDHGDIGLLWPEAQRVDIDGELNGVLIPNPASSSVVVMGHGRSQRKEQLLPLAQKLARHWNIFLFDFQSHGQRGRGPTSIGWNEARDLARALDYLEPLFPDSIMVFGESMGAAAAVFELGQRPRTSVRALVLDGCFDSLPRLVFSQGRQMGFPAYMSHTSLLLAGFIASYKPFKSVPLDFVGNLAVPVLFLQAISDNLVAPDAARLLSLRAGDNASYVYYPGHHDEPENPHLQALVESFFAEHQPR